jgi:uncharacterized protein involved in type VI secretion and phage assembly
VSTYFDAFPAATALQGAQLARVVRVDDPNNLGRVQVRLYNFDGLQDQDAPVWARVAVPFAGKDRGAFFIPDVGDEVLIVFTNGDARYPIVVGSLWNGTDSPPETLGSAVDRWMIVSKGGARISIDESSSQSVVTLKTPDRRVVRLDDQQAKIEIDDGAGNSITLDSAGITITAQSKVTVQASQVKVSAGSVSVDAAMSTFSGIVRCDTLIATSVVSSTYTPGAGNIW